MRGSGPSRDLNDAASGVSLTVDQAIEARALLLGDAAKTADLIEACLNAEAALRMLGCKVPKRRTGFLPVGVQTLVQIGNLLATMPAEVALVKASVAFACEYCGKPAETSGEDFWICEDCYALAAADTSERQPSPREAR